MSWDKNTINLSSLEAVKSTLDDLGVEYTFSILGQVQGSGNNDDFKNPIVLRKLEYGKYALVEQLSRFEDCDADDYIISTKYLKDEVPKNLPLELYAEESNSDG